MIEEIGGDKLNLMPGEYGKWFRSGEGQDFSVVFNAHEILYFEINLGRFHLSGGHGKALRCGQIKSGPEKAVAFKRADIIEYESEIPVDVIKDAMNFVSLCELEQAIKGGILEFLAQHGRSGACLYSDGPFQTYQEALKTNAVKTSKRNPRRLIMSLGGTLVFLLLVFWTHSLLNISYFERTCYEGEVWSCRKLVLIELLRGNRERREVFARLENEATQRGPRGDVRARCEQGEFEACLDLHQRGEYAPGENRLLEWACNGANDDFCIFKALSTLNTKKVPLDKSSYERAEMLLGKNPKHSELLAALEIASGKRACRPDENCARYAARMRELGLLNLADTLYEKGCATGAWASCEKYAEIMEREGEKARAYQIYLKECRERKTPTACFKAAYSQMSDPGDRKALTQAYESCLKGAENYCLFLFDRVK